MRDGYGNYATQLSNKGSFAKHSQLSSVPKAASQRTDRITVNTLLIREISARFRLCRASDLALEISKRGTNLTAEFVGAPPILDAQGQLRCTCKESGKSRQITTVHAYKRERRFNRSGSVTTTKMELCDDASRLKSCNRLIWLCAGPVITGNMGIDDQPILAHHICGWNR